MTLIVWNGSPVSNVVRQYSCGLVLNHIEELVPKIHLLTERQTNLMVENARNLGKELRDGHHLMRVFTHAELLETAK